MKKETFFLCLVLTASALLRLMYCYDMPVSGDESISLLQASGKAVVYHDKISPMPMSGERINHLVAYSDDYSVTEVLPSMRRAGMHPPLYYVFLHFVLKYAGNDILAVRLPSVLFSTLSIVLFYVLSKSLFPKIIALPAAILLAFSPYGVHYAHMVRPYPLAMLLGLLSTWLAIRLYNRQTLKISSLDFWVYILTVIAGLYTIYHFAFVAIAQGVFLLLGFRHNNRRLLMIMCTPLLVLIFYLPWLPSMAEQMSVVRSGNFYFHGASNPLHVYRYFLEFDFTAALPGTYSWYKFVLAIALTALIGLGGIWSLKTPVGRYFAVGLCAYLAFNLAADWILRTQTLPISKLLFFIIPMLFLYLSTGISLVIQKRRMWGIASLAFVLAILALNSFALVRHPAAEDDPRHLALYRSFIAETTDPEGSDLVVVNEVTRRYLLPLAHTLSFSHLDFLATEDILDALLNLDASGYSRIYAISPRYDNMFKPDVVSDLDLLMEHKGFVLEGSYLIPDHLRDKRLRFYKRH